MSGGWGAPNMAGKIASLFLPAMYCSEFLKLHRSHISQPIATKLVIHILGAKMVCLKSFPALWDH